MLSVVRDFGQDLVAQLAVNCYCSGTFFGSVVTGPGSRFVARPGFFVIGNLRSSFALKLIELLARCVVEFDAITDHKLDDLSGKRALVVTQWLSRLLNSQP